MRELISSLAVLAVVCTAVLAVCPEGELKKYIKLCCSLCAVSVFVSSLPGAVMISGFGADEYKVEDLSDQAVRMVIDRTLSNVEEAVYEAAEGKYGIKRSDLTVVASADASDLTNVKLDGIKCELYGLQNSVYVNSLENYIADRFGCYCEVRFKE